MLQSSLRRTRLWRGTQYQSAPFMHGGRRRRPAHATCDRRCGGTQGRPLSALALPAAARPSASGRSKHTCRPASRSFLQHGRESSSQCIIGDGCELMARAPEHCDQADIMPLVDSPAVQTRESDMLMHNETLRTAVGAASTPVQLGSSRAAAGGDSAAGAETGGHSQGRASCPTATGLSRLHAHWSAPCSRSLAGLRRRRRRD